MNPSRLRADLPQDLYQIPIPGQNPPRSGFIIAHTVLTKHFLYYALLLLLKFVVMADFRPIAPALQSEQSSASSTGRRDQASGYPWNIHPEGRQQQDLAAPEEMGVVTAVDEAGLDTAVLETQVNAVDDCPAMLPY